MKYIKIFFNTPGPAIIPLITTIVLVPTLIYQMHKDGIKTDYKNTAFHCQLYMHNFTHQDCENLADIYMKKKGYAVKEYDPDREYLTSAIQEYTHLKEQKGN